MIGPMFPNLYFKLTGSICCLANSAGGTVKSLWCTSSAMVFHPALKSARFIIYGNMALHLPNQPSFLQTISGVFCMWNGLIALNHHAVEIRYQRQTRGITGFSPFLVGTRPVIHADSDIQILYKAMCTSFLNDSFNSPAIISSSTLSKLMVE